MRSSLILPLLICCCFLAGCAGPVVKTRMADPRVKPTDSRDDLPEDIARGTSGGYNGDKAPWPQGGWARVTENASLPYRNIPKTTITLEFVVRSDGSVTDVVVVSGGPPDVAAAMVVALRKTKFDPGIKQGRPVNARMRQAMIIERK